MKILLVGGGTMGSVSPLVAVYEKIKKSRPETEFLFLGSKSGPEKKSVESYRISFKPICSGKFRRYFSWRNFVDPFAVLAGFFQSLFIIFKFRPNVIMVAGSFVAVPVAWAAWVWRVPVLVHQQDIIAGLANKLMANTAAKITVSFDPSLKDFFPAKTVLTGNPVREEFFSCNPEKGEKIFNLKQNLPTLLILGGGTGAAAINEIVRKSLAELLQFCQIVHITGKGKKIDAKAENYHQFEFLTNEMTEAICSADMVVSRAGASTLSELIVLAKPTILIPLPGHQEYNAQYFQKNNAVIAIAQNSLNKEIFISSIKDFMYNKGKRENLSRNIAKMMKANGAEQVAGILFEIAK